MRSEKREHAVEMRCDCCVFSQQRRSLMDEGAKNGRASVDALRQHKPIERFGIAEVASLAQCAIERSNQATALITLCIGGGMGIATIIERV